MNDNIYLLKQPIELQNEIYNYLPLNKLISLNEVCVKLNNSIDIKKKIKNLKLIKKQSIIDDWYLHTYESKVLTSIIYKLYKNEKIEKYIYDKLNTNSVYEFDKIIGWGVSDVIDNIWCELFYSSHIEWSCEELDFLRDYYHIYGFNIF